MDIPKYKYIKVVNEQKTTLVRLYADKNLADIDGGSLFIMNDNGSYYYGATTSNPENSCLSFLDEENNKRYLIPYRSLEIPTEKEALILYDTVENLEFHALGELCYTDESFSSNDMNKIYGKLCGGKGQDGQKAPSEPDNTTVPLGGNGGKGFRLTITDNTGNPAIMNNDTLSTVPSLTAYGGGGGGGGGNISAPRTSSYYDYSKGGYVSYITGYYNYPDGDGGIGGKGSTEKFTLKYKNLIITLKDGGNGTKGNHGVCYKNDADGGDGGKSGDGVLGENGYDGKNTYGGKGGNGGSAKNGDWEGNRCLIIYYLV